MKPPTIPKRNESPPGDQPVQTKSEAVRYGFYRLPRDLKRKLPEICVKPWGMPEWVAFIDAFGEWTIEGLSHDIANGQMISGPERWRPLVFHVNNPNREQMSEPDKTLARRFFVSSRGGIVRQHRPDCRLKPDTSLRGSTQYRLSAGGRILRLYIRDAVMETFGGRETWDHYATPYRIVHVDGDVRNVDISNLRREKLSD